MREASDLTVEARERLVVLYQNNEFITGRLLNWSLSDPGIRIVMVVGVAYGSDVEQAAAGPAPRYDQTTADRAARVSTYAGGPGSRGRPNRMAADAAR